jgi:beta-glucosidase
LKVSSETFDPARKFQLTVSVDIQNTGPVKGDEVVQLYVKAPESSVIQPAKKLRKFKRITLDKGRTKKVSFVLSNEDFAYWSEKKKDWYIEPGRFEIQIGSSSADIKLKGLITASHSAPFLSLLSTDIAGTIHQCSGQKDTRYNQQAERPVCQGV